MTGEELVAAALLLVAGVQIAGRLLNRRGPARLAVERLQDAGWGPFGSAGVGLWVAWGLPALAALLLFGRGDAIWTLPPEFARVAGVARSYGLGEAATIATGLGLGILLSTLLDWWRLRRGGRPLQLGRPPRLPSHARDLPAGALLAVSAGVTEELYFRLALPLLVTVATGSALLGVGVSAAAFGAAHRYQGWVGMVATALAGLFLSGIYLGGGSLLLAMAVHAAIDINALVIRPWVRLRVAAR